MAHNPLIMVRDYIYIPLGGNKARFYGMSSLFVTFSSWAYGMAQHGICIVGLVLVPHDNGVSAMLKP